MADVMLFCPTYRLEPQTVAAIFRQDTPGGIDFVFTRDNPHEMDPDGRSRRNVLYNYRRGREMFLAGDWRYLFIVESDIVPPDDALTRLRRLIDEKGADAAYGLYAFRSSYEHSKQRVVNLTKWHKGRNVSEPISYNRQLYRQLQKDGVFRTSGGGLGCVLLSRRVVEAIPFRLPDETATNGAHNDTYFTRDMHASPFVALADMGVRCGHVMTDGEVVYP